MTCHDEGYGMKSSLQSLVCHWLQDWGKRWPERGQQILNRAHARRLKARSGVSSPHRWMGGQQAWMLGMAFKGCSRAGARALHRARTDITELRNRRHRPGRVVVVGRAIECILVYTCVTNMFHPPLAWLCNVVSPIHDFSWPSLSSVLQPVTTLCIPSPSSRQEPSLQGHKVWLICFG